MLRNDVYININRDIFNCHHYNIYFENPGVNPIRAYEANTRQITQHILSTAGEYFEREALINRNPSTQKYINATSLIDGTVIKTKLSDLIFYNKFVDSCGMASHTDSQKAIWTAYKEFFERQSYISSLLFQLDATEIILRNDAFNLGIHSYLYNYLDFIKYYDISLDPNLHVVLSLGCNSKYNAAGLGTSTSLKKALIKSQYEILQYFAVGHSKYNYIRDMVQITNGDLYLKQFNSLSQQKFEEYYSYLNNSKKIVFSPQNTMNTSKNQYETIRLTSKRNFFNPYVALLNSRENSGIKIVKIFDKNQFPNMNPRTYSMNLIKRMERRFNCPARNIEFFPFA